MSSYAHTISNIGRSGFNHENCMDQRYGFNNHTDRMIPHKSFVDLRNIPIEAPFDSRQYNNPISSLVDYMTIPMDMPWGDYDFTQSNDRMTIPMNMHWREDYDDHMTIPMEGPWREDSPERCDYTNQKFGFNQLNSLYLAHKHFLDSSNYKHTLISNAIDSINRNKGMISLSNYTIPFSKYNYSNVLPTQVQDVMSPHQQTPYYDFHNFPSEQSKQKSDSDHILNDYIAPSSKYHMASKRNNGKMKLYKIVTSFVTSYYIKGQYEAMKQIRTMKHNAYLLFVGYDEGDMQPGVTGSRIKYNNGYYENAVHATIRELKEETGFTTHPRNLMWFDNNNCVKIGRHGTIYLLNAKTCKISDKAKILRDNSLKKIAVLIFGSYNDIMYMIQNAKSIDPKEQISYYACVHIDHALRMTHTIKQRRLRGLTDAFKFRI